MNEQPLKEITVNGYQYQLVDNNDPIRERVRKQADEIRALMKEYGFDFGEAVECKKLLL